MLNLNKYFFAAFLICWISSIFGIQNFTYSTLYLTTIQPGKAGTSEQLVVQNSNNYSLFLPLTTISIPEIDIPPCRWPYYSGQILYISYKWGSNLQTPGTLWRTAFETGLSEWNMTSTPIWYYHNSVSDNSINTYYDETASNRGYAVIHCVEKYTVLVEIFGNAGLDVVDSYTISQRRGIATHELGHGISIGHIPNSHSQDALMYKYTSLSFFSTIYVPQAPDILLVSQIYP